MRKTFATNSWLLQQPLLRVAIALAAGIAVCRQWGSDVSVLGWLLALAVCVLLAIALRAYARLQGLVLLVGCMMLGACLMALEHSQLKLAPPYTEQRMEVVLTSRPVEKGKVVRCDALVATGKLTGKKVRLTILKEKTANPSLRSMAESLAVGDGVELWTELEPCWPATDGYGRYLADHGYVATAFVVDGNWRKSVVSLSALSLATRTRLSALRLRQWLVERLSEHLTGKDGKAVVAAMALGERSYVEKTLRDDYAVSGASHVLALSGLHLGLLYAFLSLLLAGRRRFLSEVVLLSAVWAYVVMVGMSASVMRAALMLTLYGLLRLGGRTSASLNALALAATVLLVVDPLLLFDIGFELSFASVAAIVLFYNPLYGLLPACLRSLPVVRWMVAMMVVSLCAQLATTPLVAYWFGRVSCYGLLTNMVVVPLAYVILVLSLIMAATLWLPMVCSGVGQVLSAVVSVQNKVVGAIGSWPGAYVETRPLSALELLLLYVVLGCVGGMLYIVVRRFKQYDA